MRYKVNDKVICTSLGHYERKNGHRVGDILTIYKIHNNNNESFLATENVNRNSHGSDGNYWMDLVYFKRYKVVSRRKLDIIFEETL